MHENIKFTVRLDQSIIPLESSSQVHQLNNLHEEKEETFDSINAKSQMADWQAVFQGVRYGTEHIIYAKFCGASSNQNDSNPVFTVETIQLYIQNYRGPVTIGFNSAKVLIGEETFLKEESDEDNDLKDSDPRYPDRKQYTLKIGLEGLKDKPDDFFVLDKSRFSFEECSYGKQLQLKNGDTLRVQTWFSPTNPDFTRIFTDLQSLKSTPFVDKIFMDRYGEDVFVTKRGFRKLKEINSFDKGIVSDEDLKKAKENVIASILNDLDEQNSESQDYNDEMIDKRITGAFRPCAAVYSFFYFKT
ncbi:MAG: hypothetical protein AAF363_12350 [Bacteroidota bacterium]